jgi:tRNA nucleotidyltransferase (CCA-adding enzyme)
MFIAQFIYDTLAELDLFVKRDYCVGNRQGRSLPMVLVSNKDNKGWWSMSMLEARAAEGRNSSPKIGHAEIAAFAAESVNLKREDAEEYREQVRRLREKLDRYAADHPDYGLIKTLLSGSLAKGTSLKTLNDIDIAFYVNANKAPSAEPDLLNWLAQRLREAYPQMKPDQIQPNNHSVCIKYAVSGLSVDVVPVQYKGDPDDRGYLFATDSGKPVLTSIPLHLEFIRKRKAQQKDHFAQVIRLAKWWVRQQKAKNEKFRLKSFMSEMIVAHLADSGVSMSDYAIALEKIFGYIVKSKLKTRIFFTDYYPSSKLPGPTGKPMEIFDPVNEINNVAAVYDENHRQLIVTAAQEALEAISEARFATTGGRAIECWQDVLGPSFRG